MMGTKSIIIIIIIIIIMIIIIIIIEIAGDVKFTSVQQRHDSSELISLRDSHLLSRHSN
jgi:hypothetical protein